jgi:hypothetical protein
MYMIQLYPLSQIVVYCEYVSAHMRVLLSRADVRIPYTRAVLRTADLMTVYFALASTISLPQAHLICVN